MPKHIVDETATRLSLNEPASLGSSATPLACVGRLVGYTLAAVECEFILQTLRYFQGNRTHAADALGISVRSLRDRIRVYREQGENVPAPQSSNADDLLYGKPSKFCH
jgi:two-component system response regulator FlrC